MIWHILTIFSGILTVAAAGCNHWSGNVVPGVLVILFGFLSLKSFKGRARRRMADKATGSVFRKKLKKQK